MKRWSACVLVVILGISIQADPRRIDPKAYLEHVKFLASDDLEGRGNGSRGSKAPQNISPRDFVRRDSNPEATRAPTFSVSR
jgi:hypothetical protein